MATINNAINSYPLPLIATGSLNISQITSMYTTPVQLIPSPGSNLAIVIIYAI